MSDPKIENLLELSLDVSEDTRKKSENLSAGYDPEEKLWQVIIRYSGELLQLAGNYERVTPLLGGYAVLEVTEKQLRALAEEPQVEYIEKPKALSFAVYEGKRRVAVDRQHAAARLVQELFRLPNADLVCLSPHRSEHGVFLLNCQFLCRHYTAFLPRFQRGRASFSFSRRSKGARHSRAPLFSSILSLFQCSSRVQSRLSRSPFRCSSPLRSLAARS